MIFQGDCLQHLSSMECNSIDALVTDPPAGISFMDRAWDSDKGGRAEWVSWMTEIMKECLRVMKPGAHGLVWAIPRRSHWTMTALENAGFEIRDVVTHLFGTGFPKSFDISKSIVKGHDASSTATSADSAKQWEGFGTALKPACEFWTLVRKPCSENTVAKNVLKWGTGALNIDGCRIEAAGGLTKGGACKGNSALHMNKEHGISEARERSKEHTFGRFPANFVLDEEAADALGSASRFFYVAKASKSDRGEDNKHPTVKSTKLMGYLCRLVAPPGGTVLDPFMGSGSTGVAARAEGLEFIGIELEHEYIKMAQKRLA